jgi:FkbM family methyltransferase
MKSEFYKNLLYKIMSSLPNDYNDNYDVERFGIEKQPEGFTAKLYNTSLFSKRFFNKSNQLSRFRNADNIINDPLFGLLEDLYNLLADEESKDLLIQIVAFRLLGYKKVKLPLSTPEYTKQLLKCDELLVKKIDDDEVGKGNKTVFGVYNLLPIGYDLQLTFGRAGILTDFILEQYRYKTSNKEICVKKGDTVIDCGGFWGDTALYFSSKAGNTGKVYTFEFIPGNLKFLKNNLEQNPKISANIQLVPHPVWETSNLNVYYIDKGAASRVTMTAPEEKAQIIKSKSIDTLVEEEGIEKVDFIKMDIEGAEPFALKGAEQTLRRFKPTLAIAIYHSLNDIVKIPEYLNSLNVGYKFYIGHFTMHEEETVLFATIH